MLTDLHYQDMYVYKIICKDENIKNIYIGLTKNFEMRKKGHMTYYKNFKKGKLYDFIRANGGWDNWEMVIVEKFSCTNRKEASLKEKYWYEKFNPDLNKNYPSRDGYTWYQDNKERLLELQRIWREKKRAEKI